MSAWIGLLVCLPFALAAPATQPSPQFSRDVLPVLTKLGCNSGACHGAAHGKGGFRLSLFGFDPAFDFAQIVQDAEGRRIVLRQPEASLFLQKPTARLPHAGGQRLTLDSPQYALLRDWLAVGAPPPRDDDPTVTQLRVKPKQLIARPGQRTKLRIQADWSDAQTTEVTATARYDSLNPGVATVTDVGEITAVAAGETHIMVRFAGAVEVVRVTLPYAELADYPSVSTANFVDALLLRRWEELGLTPSPVCDDATFLRRVYLDLLGTLPTPNEIATFLGDTRAHKRSRLIDTLLSRPEFADFWAIAWADLLRIKRRTLQTEGMECFDEWLRTSLRNRRPLDALARDILTATGSSFRHGPANFYRIERTPEAWAETTAQVFLGVRLQCAKCHHHPFERWSQTDYAALAACFARVRTRNGPRQGKYGPETLVHIVNKGEQRHPRTRRIVPPRPPAGPALEGAGDRRAQLADWLAAPENPFFARNLVNRCWGHLFGRGLVEPIDDLRATNPPSNPALLDRLAEDFIAHHFDLHHLLRTILNSRAYQRSSQATPGNQVDRENTQFTRVTPKRLSAEQLADAIDFATGSPTRYADLAPGTRAIALADPEIPAPTLEVFGRPDRQTSCLCERGQQPNLAQAMHLLNSPELRSKLSDPNGRVAKLVRSGQPINALIDELYQVTLSRRPRVSERKRAQAWVAAAPNRQLGLEDLLWVLLNSREFLFVR